MSQFLPFVLKRKILPVVFKETFSVVSLIKTLALFSFDLNNTEGNRQETCFLWVLPYKSYHTALSLLEVYDFPIVKSKL